MLADFVPISPRKYDNTQFGLTLYGSGGKVAKRTFLFYPSVFWSKNAAFSDTVGYRALLPPLDMCPTFAMIIWESDILPDGAAEAISILEVASSSHHLPGPFVGTATVPALKGPAAASARSAVTQPTINKSRIIAQQPKQPAQKPQAGNLPLLKGQPHPEVKLDALDFGYGEMEYDYDPLFQAQFSKFENAIRTSFGNGNTASTLIDLTLHGEKILYSQMAPGTQFYIMPFPRTLLEVLQCFVLDPAVLATQQVHWASEYGGICFQLESRHCGTQQQQQQQQHNCMHLLMPHAEVPILSAAGVATVHGVDILMRFLASRVAVVFEWQDEPVPQPTAASVTAVAESTTPTVTSSAVKKRLAVGDTTGERPRVVQLEAGPADDERVHKSRQGGRDDKGCCV
eukprot:TRINITY_DN4317_c0_g3_i2.p1 TRINITY_DN4317_c0_g3~~TRINITY_DN4317_c0_g3_i2.p1  ORF type:complete len:399 (-),score=72.27 TRINITY_DN4317_c0_g3_i2:79-1275(-)